MAKNAYPSFTFANRLLAKSYSSFFGERSSLTTFLFHGLYANEREIEKGLVLPQQGLTVEHFRLFVEDYLSQGYEFVGPDDISRGLSGSGKYVLITFDDGYYNNVSALPVLKEYGIPAVFFISTDFVLENRSFWWDVLYREGTKRGMDFSGINHELGRIKAMTVADRKSLVSKTFGTSASFPLTDLDRPFSPSELRDFAKESGVYLGNHTGSHAILTFDTLEVVKEEFKRAQEAIQGITGDRPIAVSYPNGSYSYEVVEIAKSLGLTIGLTCDFRKAFLPLENPEQALMRLGRFSIWGDSSLGIAEQCGVLRSDFLIEGMYVYRARRMARRLKKRIPSSVA